MTVQQANAQGRVTTTVKNRLNQLSISCS